MLVTETASRTRLGGDEFYVGDLLYVQVICPPNAGTISVSAHMEYKTPSGTWAPVPTAKSELGRSYRSGKFDGVRDYVHLHEVTKRTQRHISLFLPYDAAAMADGTYLRRYVIRLWDNASNDVARTILPAEKVQVTRGGQTSRIIIRVVECTACCAYSTASKEPLQPKPEAVAAGAMHYFEASTGQWTCPSKFEKPESNPQ
jgi:hypothetical protein